jgi:hypothetical protein
MNKIDILKLVDDFGDASFDCGEYQYDKNPDDPNCDELFATDAKE